MTAALTVGMLVQHPNKPEWGPGKIVRIQGNLASIVFRDLSGREAKAIRMDIVSLRLAPDQQDEILDNLPPLVDDRGRLVLPAERLTVQQAIDRFITRFPLAFRDPAYIGERREGERRHKWEAHKSFVELLGGGRLRDLAMTAPLEATKRAMKCIQKTKLLHPLAEQARLKDTLQDAQIAKRYFVALADLLDASEINEASFGAYLTVVINLPAEEGRRVATWPVATILPFLAQPERHLFIKPDPTNAAADRLGFHLNYRSEPNWLTYSCAMRMAEIYRRKLARFDPQDMIDVQSFFWVASRNGDL